MKTSACKYLFILSLLIAVLLMVASYFGLSGDLYERESQEWRTQCVGQDLIDLFFVVPCLIVSAVALLKNSPAGRLLWPGVMLYLVYTFVIYCFDVHFNSFFIDYCAVLGLSVFGLAYFILSNPEISKPGIYPRNSFTISLAIYFLFIGSAFYLLWLSDIISAIHAGVSPAKLLQMQLPTNPVHVLDMAVFLPLFLITGVLLLRKKRPGLYLAAYLLTFMVLMDVTILVLDMLQENNFAMRTLFGSLTLLSLFFLAGLTRFYKRHFLHSTSVL